jgi:hypothetical protein
MLQKAPEVAVSSILHPGHIPAVVEFLKITGLGYTAELLIDSGVGRGEGREGEREGEMERGERRGARVDDAMFGESEGVGEEEADGGGEDEWRFGLFE